MSYKIRRVSLLLRRLESAKDRRRVLRRFAQWRAELRKLPSAHPTIKRLLLIRLDDIGDYVLFRDRLATYRNAVKWKDHSLTLLGNSSWKPLFETLDSENIDDIIWLDKNRYLQDVDYRLDMWARLRLGGFATVVTPSRTRPLLLDDMCTLAAAPVHAMGAKNSYIHASWNSMSDEIYQSLYQPKDDSVHELVFNDGFAAWACDTSSIPQPRRLVGASKPTFVDRYILCFIGANVRSKRWPAARWVEFIRLFHRYYSWQIILAGAGAAELEMARQIKAEVDAVSIVGRVTLPELLGWIEQARAVVSNDTMAAHLGALSRRPTVIVANGVNYTRFTDYGSTGLGGIATAYPEVFLRRTARPGRIAYDYIHATSADIASIRAAAVFKLLESVLSCAVGAASSGEVTAEPSSPPYVRN